MKGVAIISGGKDSIYAFYLMLQQGFSICQWITFIPRIKESYMLHSINVQFVSFQAKLSNVKHKEIFVTGEKEEEVTEILHHLKKTKQKDNFEALVSGAVKSEYQKHRLDFICQELGIAGYAPLWHKSSEKLLLEITEHGFEFLVVHAGEELEKWVGVKITKENVQAFVEDLKKHGCEISGEGGEYETFVVKTPFWKNELKVKGKKVKENNTVKFLIEEISPSHLFQGLARRKI